MHLTPIFFEELLSAVLVAAIDAKMFRIAKDTRYNYSVVCNSTLISKAELGDFIFKKIIADFTKLANFNGLATHIATLFSAKHNYKVLFSCKPNFNMLISDTNCSFEDYEYTLQSSCYFSDVIWLQQIISRCAGYFLKNNLALYCPIIDSKSYLSLVKLLHPDIVLNTNSLNGLFVIDCNDKYKKHELTPFNYQKFVNDLYILNIERQIQ